MSDFSPITQGDTAARFAPTFDNVDGAIDLTNVTITMIMQNMSNPLIARLATGNWIKDDPTNGIAHFEYSSADVASPGLWLLWIALTSLSKPVHTDTMLLEILPAPVVS